MTMRKAKRISKHWIALVAFFATPGAVAQSEADGQTAYNNACRTCHSVKADDNRLGPSLSGIAGKKSGSSKGFSYSSALADGKVTWDEAMLDKFIANPEQTVPGNNMKPFAGIADAGERKKIVDYLKTAVD